MNTNKPWFKFYGSDWLSDPKRDELTTIEQNCLTTLLCYASISNQKGKVPHLTEEKLMIKAGLIPNTPEWESTKGVIQKFASPSLGIVRLKDGLIIVKNWSKRQEVYSESRERVKNWREKRNVTETLQSNGKTRIEKNRKEESREDKNTVFSFWSSKNLIKPRTLNSDTEKEIFKALGGYSLEEIKTAIETYAAVLEKGTAKENKKYWWSHSWTLYEFLKRGLKQFVGKTPADYLITPIVYQEKPSQKVDRFDLTKKAT